MLASDSEFSKHLLCEIKDHLLANDIDAWLEEGDPTTGYHLQITYYLPRSILEANLCVYEDFIVIAGNGAYDRHELNSHVIPLADPEAFDKLVILIKNGGWPEN